MANLKTIGGLTAAMALAAAAYAQPAATDLGSLPNGETRQFGIPVTANAVTWFQFSIGAAADNSTNRYLDIYTEAATGDSEIALYDAFGAKLAEDDDDGAVLRSALSFGGTGEPRPPVGDSLAFNSRDGFLAAGTYYLAVANYNAEFNPFYDVISTGTASNTFDVVLVSGVIPPPPADQWTESPDAGDLPAFAQIPSGSGPLGSIRGAITSGDVDMYQIDICDVGFFSATSDTPSVSIDTQMWLFDANGLGVAFNDDSPLGGGLQSTLTNIYISAPGTYYLAISTWDNDALDELGQEIWLDQPFGTERTPDGPGAFGTVSSWSGSTTSGSYVLALTGVCFPGGSGCPACPADYDLSGGVDGDDIGAFFADWTTGAECADVDDSGGVDGDDIGVFFAAWVIGGC